MTRIVCGMGDCVGQKFCVWRNDETRTFTFICDACGFPKVTLGDFDVCSHRSVNWFSANGFGTSMHQAHYGKCRDCGAVLR